MENIFGNNYHEKNLISFIANGSVLPRQSGISSLPLQGKDVVKFQSPSSLEVSLLNVPIEETIEGMGVTHWHNFNCWWWLSR